MKADRTALQKSLVGPAGEHYVLYQLYRRGLLAAPAPPRTPTVDLLVLSPDGEIVAATIQVKTHTRHQSRGWFMGVKHETVVHQRMLYAFIDLEQDPPASFIVPSDVVATLVQKEHAAWLATPGRGGRPHQENPLRRVMSAYPFPAGARGTTRGLGHEDQWAEQNR